MKSIDMLKPDANRGRQTEAAIQQRQDLATPFNATQRDFERAAHALSHVWGESFEVVRQRFEQLRISVDKGVEGAKELSEKILKLSADIEEQRKRERKLSSGVSKKIDSDRRARHARKMQNQLKVKKRRQRNKGKRSK